MRSTGPGIEFHDNVLAPPAFTRLTAALKWVPMYHVRRADRDAAAHPLDSYWYYPLAVVGNKGKDDAGVVLADLDDGFAPVKASWDKVQSLLGGRVRLYECELTTNGFGSEGHPHHDCRTARFRSQHVTAILYCNDAWDPAWGGETVVFDKANDILGAVLPKPGRVTLLHGDPLHAARGVSRICPVARQVLVFKMWRLAS